MRRSPPPGQPLRIGRKISLATGVLLACSQMALAQNRPSANRPSAPQPFLIPPPPPPQLRTIPAQPPQPQPAPPASQAIPQPAASAVSSAASTTISDEDWQITFLPAQTGTPNPKSYESVYQSIPFRRAEYLANPSYRHDATMEFMFGQMRPTVVNKNDTPQRVVNPRPGLTQPYPLSKGELYSYWPLLQYGSPLPLLSPIQ